MPFDRRPRPDPVGPGQESVWDYPRPPRAERVPRRAELWHGGTLVAASDNLVRVLETSHPPGYYLPQDDIAMELLRPAPGGDAGDDVVLACAEQAARARGGSFATTLLP